LSYSLAVGHVKHDARSLADAFLSFNVCKGVGSFPDPFRAARAAIIIIIIIIIILQAVASS